MRSYYIYLNIMYNIILCHRFILFIWVNPIFCCSGYYILVGGCPTKMSVKCRRQKCLIMIGGKNEDFKSCLKEKYHLYNIHIDKNNTTAVNALIYYILLYYYVNYRYPPHFSSIYLSPIYLYNILFVYISRTTIFYVTTKY